MIKYFIVNIILIFSIGCSSSRKYTQAVPGSFLKELVTIDTTLLFEVSPDFYVKGDILYGSPVALIKPDFKLTKRNYSGYKQVAINFIYTSQNRVDYSVRKEQLHITTNTDSVSSRLVDPENGTMISLDGDNRYLLLEKRVKVKCFLIIANEEGTMIDPENGKSCRRLHTTYYGIAELIPIK